MKSKEFFPESRVEIDFNGKTYSATYSVTSKVVTLNSSYGRRSTQIAGATAEIVARVLFREILEDAHSRGEI
jgi:hypothetical protein